MGEDDESPTSLAPGFRFHPTDEELVQYYLKRKVCSKPFKLDPISVIDIYRSEPWDLPSRSKLKSRDLEWYFFSALDKKYSNGSRTNRATEKGYWKTTGKDRAVKYNSRTVGMKKTLVYHLGRAPRGERSNWVMHEYRLTDEDLEKAGIPQDAYVLCRIFQKSGTGPKNGEQYGAPFIEEEWDEDVKVTLPANEVVGVAVADEIFCGDDGYAETDNLQQNEIDVYLEEPICPPDFYYGETSNSVEQLREFSGDDQKPIIRNDELSLQQYETESRPVKNEYFADEVTNDGNPNDGNYLGPETYMDATYNPSLGDGLFLEANDLSNAVVPDAEGFGMLDEYLKYFDANDDNFLFDPSEFLEIEEVGPSQAFECEMDVGKVNESIPVEGQNQLETLQNTNSSIPKHNELETSKSGDAYSTKQNPKSIQGVNYPFIQKASHFLEGCAAPPAFASEFPLKGAALMLNTASSSSSSVRVTAGIIRVENLTWTSAKGGDIRVVLSIDSMQEKAEDSAMPSWGWFFLMFFWVLLLAVSFKVASRHIYAK